MQEGSKVTYNVDMVFVIDATESMDNVIEIVKNNAINFHGDVVRAMREKSKTISQLRIKIVVFRDYLADGENAMLTTDFFVLPDDTAAFNETIHSIEAFGGGDEPEDGLEALAFAFASEWNRKGIKKRHVVVVWSDAPTHGLGFGRADENYPDEMVRNFQELSEWWTDPQMMDQSAKRLLLFTPDVPYWSTISDNWDNVIHFPSKAGDGLRSMTYSQIINSISNTI